MATCLFCDREELTLEHIYPDWLVQLFKKHGPSGRGVYTASLSQSDGVERTWKTNSILHKAKVVCAPCNNGWMSEIESLISPILTPILITPMRRRELIPAEQLALTLWVTLRSMVIDGTYAFARQYYSQSDRLAFRYSDPPSPPPNTTAWFALIENERFGARFRIRSNANPTRVVGFLSMTLCLHMTGMQIVTWKGEGFQLRPKFVKPWKPATLQIHPTVGFVTWPPRTYVNNSILDAFLKRFEPRE